ncbi:hypothetical protein JXA88_03990, partial [Candidatus Fermentibacteria bacterium]|nr:hypothetical protein [Candidatus Fermentibacteria bacterium]
GGVFQTSSSDGYGVHGETAATGVSELAPCGVRGNGGTAIRGESTVSNGNGVVGIANGSAAYGVFGQSDTGYAGYFAGKVHVTGNFTVSGAKSFLIDHPLDPENRILAHACVESDQAVNMYRGTAILDERGEAVVELPEWFSALNTDYAYHLTPIGAPAPSLHVATKLKGNRFRIGGGEPGTEVSWMVTAQRNDAWMRMHPFVAERDKAGHERGYYLTPEAHGQLPERGMSRAKETLPAQRLAPPPEAHLGVKGATEASR